MSINNIHVTQVQIVTVTDCNRLRMRLLMATNHFICGYPSSCRRSIRRRWRCLPWHHLLVYRWLSHWQADGRWLSGWRSSSTTPSLSRRMGYEPLHGCAPRNSCSPSLPADCNIGSSPDCPTARLHQHAPGDTVYPSHSPYRWPIRHTPLRPT